VKANLANLLAKEQLGMTLAETKVTQGPESGHSASFNTTADLSKSGKFCSLLQKLNSTGYTNIKNVKLNDTEIALSREIQESLAQPVNIVTPTA
jgi:hypothetical protein